MKRTSLLRRILGLLARANDCPEGQSAARIAQDLRARHHVTDADLAQARRDLEDDNAILVRLPWTTPWLMTLLRLVALTSGVACSPYLGNGEAGMALQGHGAGRVARRAMRLREVIEGRAAEIAQVPGPMGIDDWISAYSLWGLYFASPPSTLAGIRTHFGGEADDIIKATLVLSLLSPELAQAQQGEGRTVESPQERPGPSPASERPSDDAVADVPEERPTETTGTREAPRPDPRDPANEAREAEAVRQIRAYLAQEGRIVSIAASIHNQRPAWAAVRVGTTTMVET